MIVQRTRGRPKKRRPLDTGEIAQLVELIEHALPPHHALFRTAREWHVYRWDGEEMKFKPYLSDSNLAVLLAHLAQEEVPNVAR